MWLTMSKRMSGAILVAAAQQEWQPSRRLLLTQSSSCHPPLQTSLVCVVTAAACPAGCSLDYGEGRVISTGCTVMGCGGRGTGGM